jgi:hypothetical protein
MTLLIMLVLLVVPLVLVGAWASNLVRAMFYSGTLFFVIAVIDATLQNGPLSLHGFFEG